MNDFIRGKAEDLARAILESEEYRNFVECESALKQDKVAQSLLVEFQERQQEYMSKQLTGQIDEGLIENLTSIQAKLNELESVRNYIDAYTKFVNLLGEIGDYISQEIDFDFGEAYRG